MLKKYWIKCPICNGKTRVQVFHNTVLKDFPLFCPKCKLTHRGLGYTDLGKSLLETVYGALKIDFVCNRFESNRPSAEAVLEIDPDVIAIGGIYQKKRLAELYATEPWNQLTAVKNNAVYNIPVGFVGFEQTCSTSALFIYSQANQLYPELFNYDMVSLTKDYMQRYFGYELTDEAATNMINGYYKDGSVMIE